MSTADPLRDLELLIKSRYGIILLETPELDRATGLLRHVADRLGIAFFNWRHSTGLGRDGEDGSVYGTLEVSAALEHVASANVDALYHFEDPGLVFEDRQTVAVLRDAGREVTKHNGAVVLSGLGLSPPRSLSGSSVTLRLPGPDAAEFRELIRGIIRDVKSRRSLQVELTPEDLEHLLANLKGLTLMEAEKVLTKAIVEDGLLNADDIAGVAEHKRSVVEREGLLEYYPAGEGLEEVADLKALKDWLEKRRRLLTEPERASEYGLDFPRGILLLGVPGCGKSLCAKAVASSWRLPLLKLDPSSLYSKYMGESEANFKRAMTTAEEMAPIVLWIDELEKAFGSGAGDQDGGTSKRVFGTFLSWLQDRKGDVFIVATANDVQQLPPELLRKGRFDEIFFVDLPIAEVREEIFRIHLRRRNQKLDGFDLGRLSEATGGFTGSEIEQAVVAALYTAFAAGDPLGQEQLESEIASTRPLSETMREKIDALRAWARERTRSAH